MLSLFYFKSFLFDFSTPPYTIRIHLEFEMQYFYSYLKNIIFEKAITQKSKLLFTFVTHT